MQFILNFLRETVIMRWFFGELILEYFDDYFISQSPSNQVLILLGVFILALIGATKVVKSILKLTLLWVKIALLIGLLYYLFVVVFGIDIWSLLS
jgi:hypothetical protein